VTILDDFLKQKQKKPHKPEKALFFAAGGRTYLLHAVGVYIELDLENLSRDGEAGPWAEIPKENGLWVWEGVPGWASGVTWEGIDEGGEPIYDKKGTVRRPNEEELKFLMNGGDLNNLFGPPHLDEELEETPDGSQA
jgi:hypothetical protein